MYSSKHLEELRLIQCSLLPEESIIFNDDESAWHELLDWATEEIGTYPATCTFQVRMSGSNVWLELDIPSSYDPSSGMKPPIPAVKGENITRAEQEHWQRIVRERTDEIDGTEFPVYQLISLHLLPLLHDSLPVVMGSPQEPPKQKVFVPYHALLTSHHLISPTKRRLLQQWSSSLRISGFAKVGYPGVIYAEGDQEDVEEFVTNVKSMQWLALRLRFLEPLAGSPWGADGYWTELEKVGQVVEEMKKRGREHLTLEMGIGSVGK